MTANATPRIEGDHRLVATIAKMREQSLTLAIAESWAAGFSVGDVARVAMNGGILDRAWIACSDEAKAEMLGISRRLIAEQGSASDVVALAMARNALERSDADVAISLNSQAATDDVQPDGVDVYLAVAARDADARSERHRLYVNDQAKSRHAFLDVLADMLDRAIARRSYAAVSTETL